MIWRLYYERRGKHVHCRLFAGPQEGTLGNCGALTFRIDEWLEFTSLRKVLAMDFVREMDSAGQPAGDDYVPFDDRGLPPSRQRSTT